MEEELISIINIKIAISLNGLLDIRKNLTSFNKVDEEIIKSHNEIALQADIRKATASDTLNAKSKSGPYSTTVILIIEAMGYKVQDFAKLYDSITQKDIENFKNKRHY